MNFRDSCAFGLKLFNEAGRNTDELFMEFETEKKDLKPRTTWNLLQNFPSSVKNGKYY